MNQRQFSSVLFAVVGVFIAVSRIPELVVHVVLLTQTRESWGDGAPHRLLSGAALGATLVAIGVGIALVVFRNQLAERLFPAASTSVETSGVQTAAFAVLGCYFVVHGLSRIFVVSPMGWGSATWGPAIQLILGVALFFSARRLSSSSSLRDA